MRETDRQTEIQTDRQTGRQTDRKRRIKKYGTMFQKEIVVSV